MAVKQRILETKKTFNACNLNSFQHFSILKFPGRTKKRRKSRQLSGQGIRFLGFLKELSKLNTNICIHAMFKTDAAF